MTPKTTIALVCAAALAACGSSPPTRYFSLEAVAPATPAAASGVAPVQLGAVRVPASLDRPEIVAQDAHYELAVRESDRWGAPLAQMMRSTLAQDLLTRLPAGAFVLPDAPAPSGARGIVVNVLSLRANADGRLSFEGTWTLTAGGTGAAVMTQQVSLSEPMRSAASPEIAGALSRVLGRLADRIAATLADRR